MSNDGGSGVFIGSLWRTPKDKEGAKSLATGYFGNCRLVMVRNRNKSSDNQPDFYLLAFNKDADNSKPENQSDPWD